MYVFKNCLDYNLVIVSFSKYISGVKSLNLINSNFVSLISLLL